MRKKQPTDLICATWYGWLLFFNVKSDLSLLKQLNFNSMNKDVRRYLVDLAQAKQIIPYQKLADDCDLGLDMHNYPHHRAEMGIILGDISAYEWQKSRPLLSSIVVLQGGTELGDGFYKLCELLGIGDAKKLKRDFFGIEQMRDTHNFWSDTANYRKYCR